MDRNWPAVHRIRILGIHHSNRGPLMRLLAVVALCLFVASSTSEAKPRKAQTSKRQKRDTAGSRDNRDIAVRDNDDDRPRKKRNKRDKREAAGPQSFGVPWNGSLKNPVRLRLGDGAYIRRPYRAFGTRTTVEFTKRAIEETIELHPKAHVLAVGDLSAHYGGKVSDHRSHQSGRDVDIGLFYKRKPPGYPSSFINGTEANLDASAMWTLLNKLTRTANKDGGVWVIFLDYNVQGVIYRWAKRHGVSEARLDRVFQYPHGQWSGNGIVRHWRNHAHHIHVRFKCAKAETSCH